MKLYETVGAIASIEDAIIEAGGEITDEIAAELEQMEGSLESKAESICHVIRNLAGMSEAAKVEEKRIEDLRKSRERGAESLKRYLKTCMEYLGRDKIETAVFKIALQKSPPSIGCTATVVELPECYVRIVPESREVDKAALMAAHKSGAELPEGVTVNQSTFLRIR